MTLWTAAEAARATGGRITRDWIARGVSIDSRTVAPGDLFVALSDRRDGHDFVADALNRGAAAAMVSRVPGDVPAEAPLLVVPDVPEGLNALGRAARQRTKAGVVAITGSVGKTSTKDMVRKMLSAQGRTHAAERSFNNHWGVPLTLARMPKDTEFAVIEIGMNHPGEIAPLARLARPDVAMITTVAAAHLEAFGNLEAIAREKAAIFQGLRVGGTAVVHGDQAVTPILIAAAEAAGARVITFGMAARNHHRILDIALAADSTTARARAWRVPLLLKVATPGRHFAVNALGALACVHALGADRARALIDLAAWTPPEGRGLRETLILDRVEDQLRIDLIDDAFNANPASMQAALDTLAAAEPRHGVGRVARGRRVAVLGDMLELGPEEARLHADLVDWPAMDEVQKVHCVGPRMRNLHAALDEERRGLWVETAEDLARRAHQIVDAGDIVLVKGSKGSRVSLVVDAIRKLGHRAVHDGEGDQ